MKTPTTSCGAPLKYCFQVFGDHAAAILCRSLGTAGRCFLFEPLPNDHYEFWTLDKSARDAALSIAQHTTEIDNGPEATWEFEIKKDVRFMMRGNRKSPNQAILRLGEILAEDDYGGEIEPVDEPIRPVNEWNPRIVPSIWIPRDAD